MNREVLSAPPFTDEGNFFNSDEIYVDRDDFDRTYIDVKGSVKDYKGTQIGFPSAGSKPLGGPYFSLEEVDYIRLTRNGYPGDEDYVNVDGDIPSPWTQQPEGYKLNVVYYFVTGMVPKARNVTRIFLMIDEWTTLGGVGGSSEVEFTNGFKIQGSISEAWDAANISLTGEAIGLSEPIEIKSSNRINTLSGSKSDIIMSGSDLTQYDPGNELSMNAVVATVDGQNMTFPYIRSSDATTFTMTYPSESNVDMVGVGAYVANHARTRHNINLLYSAGQLELQSSYTIPTEYSEVQVTDGRYTQLKGVTINTTSGVTPNIGGYPRKAGYLFGTCHLLADATGEIVSHPFTDLNDQSITIWTCPMPGGTPFAKYSNVKNVFNAYDKSVTGMPWLNKSVVLEGGSGTFWNQVSNSFSQASLNRQIQQSKYDYNYQTARATINALQTGANAGITGLALAGSAASVTDKISGGKQTIAELRAASDIAFEAVNQITDSLQNYHNRQFQLQSEQQMQNELNAAMTKTNFQAPAVDFVPSIGSGQFMPNTFSAYVTNVGAKDDDRLRRWFRKFGYTETFPLTPENVFVKQRVNYIRCTDVSTYHGFYPSRLLAAVNNILSQGLFLWTERPNQAAFEDNPDRV